MKMATHGQKFNTVLSYVVIFLQIILRINLPYEEFEFIGGLFKLLVSFKYMLINVY